MNAKMTITVPINDVPKEVNRILNKISIKLESISGETSVAAEDNQLLEKMNLIDNIRKKLSLIDLNLEDCQNILAGLARYEMEKTGTKNTNEGINDPGTNK